jgi:MYXO-CTERM domain-containing protein
MNLDRKLIAYAAATAAGMTAAAQTAEADIVVTQPTPVPFGSGATININFDEQGAEEYKLGHVTGPNRVSLLKDTNALSTNAYVVTPANIQPAALPAGFIIGPAATYSTTYDADLANQGTGAGNFTIDNVTGNPQYVGVKFQTTTGGPTYFGWIGVDITNATDLTGQITSYAYENTPDTAIAAGAVPEPAGLALLALGAPFLLRRRTPA